MKHLSLKLAVLGTLGLAAAQASAAFVALPTTGFAVGTDTSPYTIFNPSGNFGSGTDTAPTVSGFDTGHAIPAANDTTKAPAPYGTFTLVGSASGNIVVNNTYTNSTNVTVGTWNNRVWRNATKDQCVYGYQIVNTLGSSADYRPLIANTQQIEFNDIAYGGFGTNAVNAAYFRAPTGATSVVYRAGRTFTAVQHRATGFPAQPLTTPGATVSINGVNAATGAPTAAQTSASLNSNWVDFTFDVNALDDDGSTTANSPWVYVQTTSCAQGNLGTLTTTANAVRLRQTFQELNGDGVSPNPFIEVALPAFVPPGGSVTPAPVSPF